MKSPRRVLVIRLGAVGDVVRTLPAVGLLRRAWPRARVAWAVETLSAPLLEGHPHIDQLVVLDRRRLQHLLRRLAPEAVRRIRDYRQSLRAFDAEVSLDFQGSLKSGLVAALAGAPKRFGFGARWAREGSHLFANHRVSLDPARRHRVLRAAALVEAAGVAPGGPLEADLALRPAELDQGRRRCRALCPTWPVVALAPFSSRRQAWKRYPLERWSAVARGLTERGVGVIILGGPGERQEAESLAEAAGHLAAVSTDLDLRGLAALIAACPVLVGGDTGPMHMAWATGARVVALYGPTDPALNAPFGKGHRVLAPPRPTSRRDADRFPGISPQRVIDSIFQVLESSTKETQP
ncbi:MAG: glycosyltransferase family 9 protein [Acidobacteriota bacterium]|nr:glycosyltransferase family 9 protein [Acidobacteriota bacterium]